MPRSLLPFSKSDLIRTLRFAAFACHVDFRAALARTGLGPLWSTVGMALATAALGMFFGTVFRYQLPDYETYIPLLAVGLILWNFLAGSIHQSCSQTWIFLTSRRHTDIPLAAEISRIIFRQTFVLIINLAVAIGIGLAYFGRLDFRFPALGAGLVLMICSVYCASYLSALLCARFRDMPQVIAWSIHLAFFLTPILWVEYNVGRYNFLVQINPLATLISLIRQPLLGQSPASETWIYGISIAGIGILACWTAGKRLAHRLPYWL